MSSRLSLPKICIAMGFPTVDKLLSGAQREAQEGERFLEFRLDYLPRPEDGLAVIEQFMREQPEATVLATCRRHQNHGHFNGSIDDQLRILEAAVDAGAVAVDLEIESAEVCAARLGSLRARCYFIISYHNFEHTPALDPVVRRLAKIPADAYKLVTTARKPSDMLRLFAAGKGSGRGKTILLAMGEIGFPTRILAPAFGGLYTYAAPLSCKGTAAGQVAAKQLRGTYRVERFSHSAKVYGVIADPVCHSISPAVHNRAFHAKRMDAVYLPFLVANAHLRDFMEVAGSLPVHGFSVTIPHKQKIMRYLDYVDPLARRIGAVNTVWKKGGKWRGCNTDVDGIVGPLGKRLKLRGARILVAGNGGAARAAVFALGDAGAVVSVAGRNPDRVRALARAAGGEAVSLDADGTRRYDAIVHATPLGMHPNVDECFFPDRIPADLVFEMVYNPLETVLLRRAREQKLEVVEGTEMFLEQAVRQFEIWTGDGAPRAVMEKAAMEALHFRSLL